MLGIEGKATLSDSEMISSSEGDPLSLSKGSGSKFQRDEGGKLLALISRLLFQLRKREKKHV